MVYDMNALERRASELIANGRVEDACSIYIFMADGDDSLDAGYLGMKIGECCEKLNRLVEAKYWFNRAEQENPGVRKQVSEALIRLKNVGIEDLLQN